MTLSNGTIAPTANCASALMTALDTPLVAAGFVYVESYPAPVTVRVASTATLTLSGTQTIDGVAVIAGDRVLAKNQTTPSQNGIYVVAAGAWARATDADASGELWVGFAATPTAGTAGTGLTYWVTATGATPWVPGTDSSTWAATTVMSRIYKSPAASNSQGADWFLIVNRTADTATNVSLMVSEVWDTTTKRCRNYAPVTGSLTPTASFAVNDATGVAPTTTALNSVGSLALSVGTAGYTWWLSATYDRVVVATHVGTNDYAHYAGLYDDLLPIALSPFPLCVIGLQAVTGSPAMNNGGASREPNQLASAALNFGVMISGTFTSWTPTTLGVTDIYTAKTIPSRVLLSSARVAVALSTGMRGLLKDVMLNSVTGANGDTMTLTDSAGAVTNWTRLGTSGAAALASYCPS
jgi:hypothetical protein